MEQIKPWKLKWTGRHISSFWDWASQSKYMQSIYFSKAASHVILNRAKNYVPLAGVVIDYGCGTGDFISELIHLRVKTIGLDVSEASIKQLRARYSESAYFKGGYVLPVSGSSLPGGKADVVFVIEAVEHMDDSALHEAFKTIRNLLNTSGYIVITTPNDENLENSEVFCPNCGCLFHRMQHQRAWTAESLSNWMTEEGFDNVMCEPYHLYDRGRLKGWLQKTWRNIRYPKANQLMYIGRLR